jgi:hypothetical protein
MPMHGFFDLQRATDLLGKLERDYARLQQDSEDVDLAYNFFVTAENMPEWVKDKAFKHVIQQQELILTLCNELTTGAKHVTAGKEKPAIASAERDRYVEEGYIEPGYFEEPLLVRLSPTRATQRGQEAIDVLTLAGEVLAFWQRELRKVPPP